MPTHTPHTPHTQAWIKENNVLEVVLRENLHQPQYVEKLDKMLKFCIREKVLSIEDLDKIWASQEGKHEAMADILEQAGDFQGLVSLLVDLAAMGKKTELSGDKTAGEEWLDPAHKSLPLHLCVLVSSLLQRHMACLQQSEHNTCVVFER